MKIKNVRKPNRPVVTILMRYPLSKLAQMVLKNRHYLTGENTAQHVYRDSTISSFNQSYFFFWRVRCQNSTLIG